MAANLADRLQLSVYVQVASVAIVILELAIRYGLSLKAAAYRPSTSAWYGLKFDLDHVLISITWLCFGVYSGWFFYVMNNQASDLRLFYTSRLLIQVTLFCSELSRVSLCTRLLCISRKEAFSTLIYPLFLGSFSIIMVSYSLFKELPQYHGGTVSGLMILIEAFGISTVYSVLRKSGVHAKDYTLWFHCGGWALRAISTMVTLILGGFYMRTFWSQLSSTVLYCQQCNLFVSVFFCRGVGILSSARQISNAKRLRKNLTGAGRKSEDARSDTYPTIDEKKNVSNDYTNNYITNGNSESGTIIEDEAMSVEHTINDNCTTFVEDSIHINSNNEDVTNCSVDEEAVNSCTNDDATNGKYENRVIVDNKIISVKDLIEDNRIVFVEDDTTNIDDEDDTDYSTDEEVVSDPVDVRIVGAERDCSQGSIEWWYLMKPVDKTVFVGEPEPDYFTCAFGNVEEAVRLNDGYYRIHFSPIWNRSDLVPEQWTLSMWRTIGPRFWRVSSSSPEDGIRWDGETCQYTNFSKGWSMHLCDNPKCEQCIVFDTV